MAGNIPQKSEINIFIAAVIFLLICGLSYNLYPQEGSNPGSSNSSSNYFEKGMPLFSLEYCINKSFTDYTSSSTISGGWRGMGKFILPLGDNIYYGPGLFFGTGKLTGADLALQNDPRGFPGQFFTSIFYVGLGVEFSYKVSSNFYPYTFFSLTNLSFHPEDIYGNKLPNAAKGVYKNHVIEPGLEIGGRYFITNKIAINASLTYYIFPNDYLDDLEKGASNDKYASINLGFTYASSIGGGSFNDSDGDGVEDSKDMCPNTPKGIEVDEFGCPIDSDHDGVPDYEDKCPNTPPGVKVDIEGCPIDSDHDGIPDYLDKCPQTLAGLKVDSLGCPLDSDHDSVPDYLDKCPNTPNGINVDANGCPVKAGENVKTDTNKVSPKNNSEKNENVRIIPPAEIGSISLYMDTYFEPSRDKLLPKAYTLLDILVNTIKAYPDSKWTIYGYTDSTGAAQHNLEISKTAARTVAKYLEDKGVNPSQLKVDGFGEKNPVFSNDFPDGRALNRRVEVKYVPKK